jgi:hypothetical protein
MDVEKHGMTREEAMLKLLAMEPETRDRLIVITGWPADETIAVLDQLMTQKRVSYSTGASHGRRVYFANGAQHAG